MADKIFKVYDLSKPDSLILKGFIRGLPPEDVSIQSKKEDINALQKASPEILARFEIATTARPAQMVFPQPALSTSSLLGSLGFFPKKEPGIDVEALTSSKTSKQEAQDQPTSTKPKGPKST